MEFSFISGNILILLIVWAVTDFAHFLPNAYYSLYVESLGASPQIIGSILSASLFIMAFLQLAGGYWADKRGRKIIIVATSFARALIYIIFATAPTWHFILFGEMLVGVVALSHPAMSALVADSLPPDKRGLGYSLSMLAGVTSILSPVVAGILYIKYGLVVGVRTAYLIVSICWLTSGVMFLKLEETLKFEKAEASLTKFWREYPKVFKECLTVWKFVPKTMLYLFLIFTPLMFFVRMCMPYYVLYANRFLKVDEFQWAVLQTVYSITFYCLLLPVGKMVDTFGRKKPLILSSVSGAIGMALFLHGHPLELYLFSMFSAACNALAFTAYPSMQTDLTPKEYRGKLTGLSNFSDCVLGSIALLSGGILYEAVSPIAPFLLLLAAMVLTAITTAIFVAEPQKKEV
ncbi:MAG: MFS transporter [Candidatus Bathyarchaeia archaeon]